jgi:DNA polymerase III delta prime subunit
MALRLAARLNCDAARPNGAAEPPGLFGAGVARGAGDAAACGEGSRCRACGMIRALEHADLHLIYPVPSGDWEKDLPAVIESRREDFFAYGEFGTRARSVGIDLVRHVIEALSKYPFEGRRSVVVVFEAHLATAEAQNALLKILEEPPSSAAIVLVTEYPDRLLPTILSRCYEVRFEPLSNERTAEILERFRSVEREEAHRIAAIAQGNLRRAVKLLEERFLGLWRDAAVTARLVIDGKGKELLAEAETLARRYSREEARELLAEMSLILGFVLRGRDGRLDAAGEAVLREALGAERLGRAAERDVPEDIRKMALASESLRRNADLELTLAHLLLDLTGAWY